MEPRQHLITSRNFAAEGIRLTFDQMSQRRQALLRELRTDLPCLRHLTGSTLVDALMPTSTGTAWLAILVETTQRPLPLTVGAAHRDDAFHQDVERVTLAQKQLPSEFRLALSPSHDPCMDERVAELRVRAKRDGRAHRLLISDAFENRELELPHHLPTVLPLAEHCVAEVTVVKLTRTWATVKLRRVVELSGAGNSLILAGTSIRLRRGEKFASVGAGHQLQTAMDTRQPLTIQASLGRRWDDGTPYLMELRGILEPQS